MFWSTRCIRCSTISTITRYLLVLLFFAAQALCPPGWAQSASMRQFQFPIRQLAELTATDGVDGDAIGASVAISGNTIVVGAPRETVNGNLVQGAAYVFVRPAGGWANLTQVAKLTSSDATQDFGEAVAISGDTIVVGAPRGGNNFSGTVYVFTKPSGGWRDMTQTAELASPEGIFNDGFGWWVGVSGNTIVVSGPGPAYVYVRPQTGWADSSSATATLNDNTGAFGNGGVAISGDTIVVGYNGCCDDSGNIYPGQVDLFVKPAGGWATAPPPTAILTATDESPEDYFGLSVAISGDTVIAGSPYHPFSTGHGAAYIFVKPSSGWTNMTQTVRLRALNTDQLGYSVAIAPRFALAVDHQTGNAYAFAMPKTGWKNTSGPTAAFSGASGYYQGVAVQGHTIVIGSPGAMVNGVPAGAAFVY